MVENIRTFTKINNLRKHSYYEQDEENEAFKNNSTLYKKEHFSYTNSRHGSEISKNKNGFAFSLGSRVLRKATNEQHQIKSLFNKRESKIRTSIIYNKDKVSSKELYSNTNTPKLAKRILNKLNENLKSDLILNHPINQRRKSVGHNYINPENIEEIQNSKAIIQAYKKYDEKYEPNIIKKLKEVKNCSILKYGIKPSTNDISYSYCLTCDSSLINPICIPCLNHCHKGHNIKEKYELGKIICSCGERSHIVLNEENSNYKRSINDCLCNEWSYTSKLNVCYLNNNSNIKDNHICLLCYNFCITKKNNYSPIFFNLKEGETFPRCICNNKKIHNEFRFLLNLIEKLTSNYKKYEGLNMLHPTQIINTFIQSKKSFQYNCDTFYDLYNSIKNNNFINSSIHYSLSKVDFYSTNCFVIMKSLLNIVSFNNHTNISYYSEEVEKFFSFEIIKNLIENLKKSNLRKSSIWILSYNYLKLFKKIYISNKMQLFDKYKLEDLDNFSSCQRFSLFYEIENKFPEGQKIIEFLIIYLQDINTKGFDCIEAIQCIGEVFGILKKFAYYNMISNGDIVRILQEIGKFFINLNILRNSSKLMNKTGDQYKLFLSKIENENNDMTRIKSRSSIKMKKNLSSINSINESENIDSPGPKINESTFYDEEIPLYYTLVKMIRIFYLNFNDKLVHNFINDKQKDLKDDNLINNNISFGYMKNDFGRELFKVTIRILYVIHSHNKNKEKNYLMCQKIFYQGMKILEYSLMNRDSYLISIIRSFFKEEFYEKKIISSFEDENSMNLEEESNINYNNAELNLLIKEKNNLDDYNKKFLNFEINNEEFITNYEQSLDNVLKDKFQGDEVIGFKENILISILKSKYFFSLSKIFQILYYFEEMASNQIKVANKKSITYLVYTKEKIAKDNNLLKGLCPKILFFYKNFIFHCSDNSLLILSHYIFNDLTKMPINFGVDIFSLFHSCLENISENNIGNILNNSSHYLENLYNYLVYLKNKKFGKIYECLLIFLKCFYILAICIKTADYESLIKVIRQKIIDINTIFNIAKNYFNTDEEGVSEIIKKIEKENQNENNELHFEDSSEKENRINGGIENGSNENNININNYSKKKENIKFEINILEQCFILDLQLINDFFNFAISEQKEKITKLIDVHKIVYCLKFTNITHLRLRTQMIRFVRKILIDMNYNKDCNLIYINSIINNEDNLSILKLNPLVNNFKYPTKFFSYVKDFWNLSLRSKVHLNITNNNNKISENLFCIKKSKEEDSERSSSSSSSFDSSSFDSEQLKSGNENKEEKGKIISKLNTYNTKVKMIEQDKELETRDIKNSYTKNRPNLNQKDNIKCFDSEIYDLLINELSNVEDILTDINTSSTEEMQFLGEYFQNGLLIPIIYFFKKHFTVAHNLKGSELFKLYDLAVQTINLKITISEFKYNFWDDKNNNDNSFNEDLFSTYMINNKKDFLINGNIFIDNEIIKKCNKVLKKIKNKHFSCFDYTLLYSVVEKNFFNLLSKYNQISIGELFSEKEEDDINIQMLSKPFSSVSTNNTDEKLYRIYLLYKNNKNAMTDESNSSLFNILPEICIEYETNYRNLLIFILISNGLKLNIDNNSYAYSINLYFLLYKLLSLQTSRVQSEIINLLGGQGNDNYNLGFMLSYSQHLMKRIILSFIDIFNPRDKFYDDNYIYAISLVKIFKFLCEEHNNFFQIRLIKTLNYEYKNIIPLFYKEDKNFEEYQEFGVNYNYKNGLDFNSRVENAKIKNIKFFDFFLFVLLKISLISDWESLKKINPLNKNKYKNIYNENKNIYDLFSAIIEMLNEIIQGNKEEFLSKIGNPFLKEDEDNFSSDEEKDYNDLISMEINIFNGGKSKDQTKIELENYKLQKRKYQKLRIQRDPFTCFIKGMIKFIFIDNNDSQILFQLRNDLMNFFTSILEEKNCNEEVQKLIMKYLNIHRIFNSISVILKNYFLLNTPLDSLPSDFFESKQDKSIEANPSTFENYLTQKNNTLVSNNYNKDREKEKEDNNQNNNQNDNQNNKININSLKEKLVFDHRLLNFYYDNYYSNKDFFVSNEFQLTNAFYKYIKLIAVLGKNEEIKNIIEEADATSVSLAIKRFELNLQNIKKDYIKDFNIKDVKNSVRLSKSLKKQKTVISQSYKNKKFTIKTNPINSNIAGVQLVKLPNRTNKNFKTIIISNSNLMNKFSFIQGKNKNENLSKSNISNIIGKSSSKKNNILIENKIIDNSDSSERFLGLAKKENDNESTVNKLQIGNHDNINSNNHIINNSDIKKNSRNKNKINAIIDTDKKNDIESNQSTYNTKMKISLNRQKPVTFKEKKPRLSVFVRAREKNKITCSLIRDNTKRYYDKDYIERFYIVKFFESITSTIEIRNEDCGVQTVIFTHLPEMIYLSNGSKAQFEQKVNRESEISKKNDLVRHLEYFHKEIEYFKNNFSALSHWVSKIDFVYIKWISYIYALILNLLVMFTIHGDKFLSLVEEDNSYEVIKGRRNDKRGIQDRINYSINNWQTTYDILNYLYLILNGVLIFIWVYFQLPLYYELDKIKYLEENNHKKILNLKDKLYIIFIMIIYKRNSISSLIYEFVISIISCILNRGQIIFPFLLLAIVDLNETLKNVILSIKYRHKEFILCFFLAFIIMYGLSNIAFFYFNSDFEQELDYYDDNVCKSLIFCALNAFDSGLRARGGIGDSGERISYIKAESHYIKRLILDDVFFFLIVIISIDLVFGIIVGEFAALREETQKHINDRKYHCFICHVNKNTLEKNRKNFSVHVNKEHNLWNYVSYMIFVKLSNLHNLNSINSYAREKIDNKDISWLPSYKDLNSLDKEDDDKKNVDEENFKIEDENINVLYAVKPT